MPGRALPSGTVTFLFTDVAGSTRLWHAHPDAMRTWLARHDEVMLRVIEERGGVLFKHTGDGVCAAFALAPDAIDAAVESHRQLATIDVGLPEPVRIRVGLHAGDAEPTGGDYFGPPLNRCARVRDLGHGGQTLCSAAVGELARDHAPAGVALVDLGRHALRDLPGTEHLFEARGIGDTEQFPPLRADSTTTDRLPRPPTVFIGRERDLAEVGERLDHTRLLTLVGPGGVGKTRLAIQAAADRSGSFDLGACFVDLAATDEADRVDAITADALAVSVAPGRAPADEIAAYVGSGSVLLVIDNCEHVLNASARLVDVLLHACPNLTVLATSREPLRVRDERVFNLRPLSGGHVRADEDDDAVRLFVERAERVGGAVSRGDLSIVAEICNRLDGMPLAIELAAARIRHLSAQQILDRLDDRFKLLRSDERGVDERHRTLRATIDWSHELLSTEEQALFRRLAVFTSDFDLEMAEGVCAFGEVDEDNVIDLVASLVDRSLLVSDQGRYSFLETVREYAAERVDRAGELDAVRERHFRFFAAKAEPNSRILYSSVGRQQSRVSTVRRDVDNYRVALEWALEGDPAGARAFFADVWHDFLDAGAWDDLPGWMQTLAPDADTPDTVRLSLAAAHAYWRQMLGDMAAAYDEIEALLPLAREVVPTALPTLLTIQGVAAQASRRGDPIALLERARAAAIEFGDEESEMEASEQLAEYLLNIGRYEEADAMAAAVLARARGAAQLWTLSTAAITATFVGDIDRAVRLAAASVDAAVEAMSFPQLYARLSYAVAVAAAGDASEAAEAMRWVVDNTLRYDVPLLRGDVLAAAGGVALFAGDAERAAALLGAARTEFGRTNSWRRPAGGALYVQFVSRTRAALEPDIYERARRHGRDLDRDAAVEMARLPRG